MRMSSISPLSLVRSGCCPLSLPVFRGSPPQFSPLGDFSFDLRDQGGSVCHPSFLPLFPLYRSSALWKHFLFLKFTREFCMNKDPHLLPERPKQPRPPKQPPPHFHRPLPIRLVRLRLWFSQSHPPISGPVLSVLRVLLGASFFLNLCLLFFRLASPVFVAAD